MRVKDDETLEKTCRFCEYAVHLSDRDHVLCSKHGIVEPGHYCRKFIYDPLKRRPAPVKNIAKSESGPSFLESIDSLFNQ